MVRAQSNNRVLFKIGGRKFCKLFLFALSFLCVASLCAPSVFAKSTDDVLVKDVRIASSGDVTRIVFGLSRRTTSHVFTLSNPERVVIDLDAARLDLANGWPDTLGVIKEFRAAPRGNGVLRIVVDVTRAVQSRTTVLQPNEGLGDRLVLDLVIGANGAIAGSMPTNTAISNDAAIAKNPTIGTQPEGPTVVKSLERSAQVGRDIIVAIDAGHGGEDPGASGRRGTREKDVTLAVARKLKTQIDNEPGMRAVLTRDGDYFVPLRDRMVRARKQDADLFVSIHADAVANRDVSGSSVYVLSAGRATNEAARMLADRENAADLMGGLSLENKDNVLASVLLDLSQGASMSASNEAAEKVLRELNGVGDLLDNEVKHASLKVLTSPDMPSMLIETAFISNPIEEARLNTRHYQQRLAEAIAAGVRRYFHANPPPGTQVAQMKNELRNRQSATHAAQADGAIIAATARAP